MRITFPSPRYWLSPRCWREWGDARWYVTKGPGRPLTAEELVALRKRIDEMKAAGQLHEHRWPRGERRVVHSLDCSACRNTEADDA